MIIGDDFKRHSRKKKNLRCFWRQIFLVVAKKASQKRPPQKNFGADVGAGA